LVTTFAIFPLLGLFSSWLIDQPIYLGLLFLCALPSTVQSSIASTSSAGGNVPAAICAASTSNILGIFLTPALVTLLFSTGGNAGIRGSSYTSVNPRREWTPSHGPHPCRRRRRRGCRRGRNDAVHPSTAASTSAGNRRR